MEHSAAWQELHDQVAAELRVFRVIKLSHAASGKERQDFVSSDRGSGRDGFSSCHCVASNNNPSRTYFSCAVSAPAFPLSGQVSSRAQPLSGWALSLLCFR